jgi:hypothetical protein
MWWIVSTSLHDQTGLERIIAGRESNSCCFLNRIRSLRIIMPSETYKPMTPPSKPIQVNIVQEEYLVEW